MLPIKEPLNWKAVVPEVSHGLGIWIQTKYHHVPGGSKSWAGNLSANFTHLSFTHLFQSLGLPLEGALPPQLEPAHARESRFTQA